MQSSPYGDHVVNFNAGESDNIEVGEALARISNKIDRLAQVLDLMSMDVVDEIDVDEIDDE